MEELLSGIESPADVKRLTIPQLTQLAEEIRERLIVGVAKTGGHLGPNLGVVELTLALHYVFDTPRDSFVFDVSHQAYVHKMLTGRNRRFETIRQPGGLNGFMLRSESEHDSYGAGHAGTALSAALGMAVARDMSGGKEHIVALCGDAAFTNGISFEALNNIAAQTRRLIVVLNDNAWSIDKNVGAIAQYFHKMVTNPTLAAMHDRAATMLERFGGKAVRQMARKAEEAAKGLIGPGMLFEEFGLSYYGPVDGHNLPLLIETFKFLKQQNKPVMLHAITQKGRGFQPAEEKQKKFHGLGPYDPETGETKSAGQKTYSEIFAETLCKLADGNDKIVAITAAMPSGTGLDLFRPRHPTRYFDVGIAEAHAVIFAAGMATKGYKPFCAIYSTFLQRAFDPIVHDVCLQNLPVVFCMDRGGLSSDDGPTHHGLFDISYSAQPAQHRPHGSQGRGRAGRHDVHGDAARRAGGDPLPARRGAGRAGEGAAPGAGDRRGRGDRGRQRCCDLWPWRDASRGGAAGGDAAARGIFGRGRQSALCQAHRPRVRGGVRAPLRACW